MKALLILLMLAAIAILVLDDRAKRNDLEQSELRADDAVEKANGEAVQIQQLTNQVNQLNAQFARLGNMTFTTPRGAAGPTPVPAWFQNHLNGGPTLLDPHGGNP